MATTSPSTTVHLSTDTSVLMPDGRLYHARSSIVKDHAYYSKTWHRRFGAKVTETNRRVELEDQVTKQITVVATYERWPNRLKDVPSSSGYIAILKCLTYADLPPLMGADKNLDACIAYILSRRSHG